MAVRAFDGSTHEIILDDGGLGAIASGPHTMLMLVFPVDQAGITFYLGFSSGATVLCSVMNRLSGAIEYGSSRGDVSCSIGVTSGAWQVIALSKAGGTADVRGHRKVLGSGVWDRDDSTSSLGDAAQDCDLVEIGCLQGADNMNFQGAVMALFNQNLSDVQIDGIETAASTQALNALGPIALWELNQASIATPVSDLVGTAHEVSKVGTTVVNGNDPAWTFGLAPPDVPGPANKLARYL